MSAILAARPWGAVLYGALAVGALLLILWLTAGLDQAEKERRERDRWIDRQRKGRG